MNKVLSILCALLLTHLSVHAQVSKEQVEQRARVTRIADLLTSQPAKNAQKLQESMRKLDAFDSASVSALVQRLQAPGSGKNAKIKYALNSYSYYVREEGKEADRVKFVSGLIDGLNATAQKDNKGFVIALLQTSGKDEAVPILSEYLEDRFLAGKAARALATIGSDAASAALLEKLETRDDDALIPIVQALGDLRYAEAETALLTRYETDSPDLKKVLHFALSNIAGTDSYKTLRKAARDANYTYDETNALSAYTQYANRMMDKGESKRAEKIGRELLRKSKDETQLHSRLKGLWLLTELHGPGNMKELIRAASNENLEYRSAALEIAAPFMNRENQDQWERALKKSGSEVRASMMPFFLKSWNQDDLVALLTESLESRSAMERAVAVKTIGQSQGDQAIPVLLTLLNKGDSSDRKAIHEAFLTMQGDQVSAQLTAALPEAAPASQAMILNVLANRAYGPAFSQVYLLLDKEDDKVKREAYKALKTVSRSNNLTQLIKRLDSPLAFERSAVQDAIVEVVRYSPRKNQDIDAFLAHYHTLNENQKIHAIQILSGIGGDKCLQAVSQTLRSDSPALWDATVLGLANWSDAGALANLIKFSKNSQYKKHFNAIMDGIIRLTPLAEISDEQKVLIYRDAMKIAQTTEQRTALLKNLEETKTYNAFMFAGGFLDDTDLQAVAATTAMNIALDRTDFYGSEVRSVLAEVFDIVNRRRYLGEGIEKHLSELPKEEGYVSLFENKLTNNGFLTLEGNSEAITTLNQYGDFDMLLDWQVASSNPDASAGLILRGVPVLGLLNSPKGADGKGDFAVTAMSRAPGEWNTLKVEMRSEKVTLYVNGERVVDNLPLKQVAGSGEAIPMLGAVGLLPASDRVNFRSVYLKEIPRKEVFVLSEEEQAEGFKVLFDGTDMDSWIGNKESYVISEEGTLAIFPKKGSGGNLYSKEEFSDFIYRLEFRLTSRANNGLGLRAPLKGNASFLGMEVAILDDTHEVYKDLAPWQYNGSVYGVIPAKRGYLNPVGEWNVQEIYLKGNHIRVTLNGTIVLEGDLAEASKNGTVDGKDHPGLKATKGHLAFLGHGSEVHFRRIRIKELKD